MIIIKMMIITIITMIIIVIILVPLLASSYQLHKKMIWMLGFVFSFFLPFFYVLLFTMASVIQSLGVHLPINRSLLLSPLLT